MNLNDYILDWRAYDWGRLLKPWRHFFPASFEIRMMNRFGDLFVIFDDQSVNFFDAGADKIEKIADNWDEFCDIVDQNLAWLVPDIVDECVTQGKILLANQVYSLTPPPILGGPYSADSAMPLDIEVHFELLGQICQHTRDLPDGATVEIKIVD